MNLSHNAVELLSRQGRYQQIVSDCGLDPSRINRIESIEHRLTLADSLVKVGHLETGKAIVAKLLPTVAGGSARARCEAILGMIARHQGNLDEAIQRLQHAARLFKDDRNTEQAAYYSIQVLRITSERQPPQGLNSLLSDVRTLVTRAGDPHLTARLHESVARYEAQAGNFDEARRHLKTAM